MYSPYSENSFFLGRMKYATFCFAVCVLTLGAVGPVSAMTDMPDHGMGKRHCTTAGDMAEPAFGTPSASADYQPGVASDDGIRRILDIIKHKSGSAMCMMRRNCKICPLKIMPGMGKRGCCLRKCGGFAPDDTNVVSTVKMDPARPVGFVFSVIAGTLCEYFSLDVFSNRTDRPSPHPPRRV